VKEKVKGFIAIVTAIDLASGWCVFHHATEGFKVFVAVFNNQQNGGVVSHG
jgi:hypothetical protein